MSDTTDDGIDYMSEIKPGEWVWCLHCERCYQAGEFRRDYLYKLCPYPGCDGDTFGDQWRWAQIRWNHAEYPCVPERGVVYPMY